METWTTSTGGVNVFSLCEMLELHSLKLTSKAPENCLIPTREFHLQQYIFQGYLSFMEGNI